MTVTEYKRKWFEARRSELHGRGLKDAAIARQCGVKPPYISEVVNGGNVGDALIDRMCNAFGFTFPEGVPVNETPNDSQQQRELIERILKGQEETGALIRTLAPLVAKIVAERDQPKGKGH